MDAASLAARRFFNPQQNNPRLVATRLIASKLEKLARDGSFVGSSRPDARQHSSMRVVVVLPGLFRPANDAVNGVRSEMLRRIALESHRDVRVGNAVSSRDLNN